jgi:uncharacterized protein
MNIFEAIMKGDKQAVLDYLKNGGDSNVKNERGYSALNMAAFMNKIEIANLLKKAGAVSDFFMEVALGNLEEVKNYIQKGVNVNQVNAQGHTPIMYAAHQGKDQIVKLLVAAKADINAKHSISGNTVLIGAVDQGYVSTVKLLIEAKADINAKNKENKTALTVAKEKENNDIINLLINAGAKE